jgi:putative spermidine/putrescine transport system permease protein
VVKKKTYIYLLALVPFLIVALLYEIVPLITVILKSFQPDAGTGFTLENYQTVFFEIVISKSYF